MKVSFEGIGESVVTFYNNKTTAAIGGAPVKMSGNGEVSACSDGDKFFGAALACDADFAAVQTDGYFELGYTGSAPAVGFVKLVSNGAGGVKAAETGGEFLVVDVDTVSKIIGLIL
ncbi:MAG: hypothetical protein KBI01_07925 [Oscillospiraceae bacterium]|nr:hypothetical protein [Oscillospiraceae bacterium]